MRLIREPQLKTFIKSLQERSFTNRKKGGIQNIVREIINDVRRNGDKAVKKYTEKYDSIKLRQLTIDKKEIEASGKKASRELLSAIKLSAKRIRAFHEFQKEESWYFSEYYLLRNTMILLSEAH